MSSLISKQNKNVKTNLYRNVINSRQTKVVVNVNDVLDIIKHGYNITVLENGKQTKLNSRDFISEAREVYKTHGKKSERYIKIKQEYAYAVTFASSNTTTRNNSSTAIPTGYIYFDIDNQNNVDLEVLKQEIFNKYTFVKAIWYSISKNGLGGLISINEYKATEIQSAKENYYAFYYDMLNDFGVELDLAVKDIFTRCNAVSWDDNILVREDSELTTYTKKAEEPKVYKKNAKNSTTLVGNNGITTEKGTKAHQLAYHSANRFYSFVAGQRTNFTVAYASKMNMYGVEFNEMVNNISLEIPYFKESEQYETALDVYKRYANQFGTKKIENVSYDEESKHEHYVSIANNAKDVQSKLNKSIYTNRVITNYVLEAGKKLSDLKLTSKDVCGKLLIAPTGTGKTYFITHLKGSKIVVVPSQNLCEELANKYNGKAYNQYNKDVSVDDNLIYVTYASFSNLVNKLDALNCRKYDVYIDECHNFTTSASKTFMLKQLTNTLETLKTVDFNTITLMTATPISTEDEFLNSFDRIVVTQEEQKNKQFALIKCKDSYKTVQYIVERAKQAGNYVAILLNNTKNTLHKYKSTLKGYNFQIFNSTTKNEEYFVELIQTGNIKKESDGIISTTVLKEGNSFMLANTNTVDVIVVGKFGADEIEQFSARFRNATNINVYVIKGEKYKDARIIYNFIDEAKIKIELAQFNANHANKEIEKQEELGKTFNKTIKYVERVVNDVCVRFNEANERYEVDTLLVSNQLYELNKTFAWRDSEVFASQMGKYGFTFQGIRVSELELEQEEKAEIVDDVNEYKMSVEEEKADIYNEIIGYEGDSEWTWADENALILTDKNNLSKMEREVRYKLDYIYKVCGNDAELTKRIYNEIRGSNQKFTKFKQQIASALALQSEPNRPEYKLCNAIREAFSVGQEYTSSEVKIKINEIVKMYNPFKMSHDLTEKKCNMILQTLFTTENKTKKVKTTNDERITIRYTVIVDDNPLGFEVNYKRNTNIATKSITLTQQDAKDKQRVELDKLYIKNKITKEEYVKMLNEITSVDIFDEAYSSFMGSIGV